MIKSKKDLQFYIAADRIMSGKSVNESLKEKILSFFNMGGVISFITAMRHVAYHNNCNKTRSLLYLYWMYKYKTLGIKYGFSIGYNSLGYGLMIPHYGTIVVNSDVTIGNYAVLHTCTCIGGNDKVIGDGLYLATGSQIMGKLKLGDNVTVAAHSLVNKTFENNILLAGAPACIKKENYEAWYKCGVELTKRVGQIEELKNTWYNGNN